MYSKRILYFILTIFFILWINACEIKKNQIPSKLESPVKISPYSKKYTYIKTGYESLFIKLYKEEKFQEVEEYIVHQVNQAESDSFSDYSLRLLYKFLTSVEFTGLDFEAISEKNVKERYEAQKSVLDRWIAQKPKLYIPFLLRSSLNYKYAFALRGGDFARNVDKDAWKPFYKYINLAQKDGLIASKLYQKDPIIWSNLISINRARQKLENIQKYYSLGKNTNPYHIAVRIEFLDSITPKWIGYNSSSEMFAFSQIADKDAEYLNAPLLRIIIVNTLRELYPLKIESLNYDKVWTDISEIYTQLISKYPNLIRLRFNYAYDAMIANKYKVAKEQFDFIGNQWIVDSLWSDVNSYEYDRNYVDFWLSTPQNN